MNRLPWAENSFDVVTSFRGIWGTTPDAIKEAARVLRPGGRLGITVWGHLKASSGAWALAPFRLAAQPKVENQAAMVALGRPGVGEQLLTDSGFGEVRRIEVPFAWEFPDPGTYARALASTGPAYEAVQNVGEDEFYRAAVEIARDQIRDGSRYARRSKWSVSLPIGSDDRRTCESASLPGRAGDHRRCAGDVRR
jgi:SAM-dependent methyltransferase